MRSLLSIAILAVPMSGCAEVFFRYRCPPLTQYSAQFQKEAAEEKKGPRTAQLVSDYGKQRDACRAAEAAK